MIGYILGLGDRHIQNILVDQNTAELVHIDFGFAFEQSKILPTPETVPFRLTRDIIDGFGPCGVEGTFRKAAEATLKVKKICSCHWDEIHYTYIRNVLIKQFTKHVVQTNHPNIGMIYIF